MSFDEWLIFRLRTHGAYAGVLDKVHGRETIEALKRFQAAEKLPVTGRADEATVAALRKAPAGGLPGVSVSIPAEPVWMREARRFMGLKEIAGAKSNPTIMGWAKRLGGWVANYFTNDDIPWCGLAVAHWIGVTLPSEPLPTNPLSALAWAKFGSAQSVPALGAVMVFGRKGGGHVGFYVGEDPACYHILGGNQSNSVSITRIEKGRLEAIRWPRTGEPARSGRVLLTASGAVSRNEQ